MSDSPRAGARSAGLGALGLLVVVVVWQVLAKAGVFGDTVSPPSTVIRQFSDGSRRSLLLHAGLTTGKEAVEGFGWALVAAAVAGLLVVLVPVLRRGMDQLATIESAIPFLALAPILLALFSREHIPTAMGATTAFFPLYIAFVAGLQAVSTSVTDVCTVLGASRRDTLLRARIPASLPLLANGAKVGMPLAIVGSVIGEWFGTSTGVGPIMLVAMRDDEMAQMWASVSVVVVVALVLYGVFAAFEWATARRFA